MSVTWVLVANASAASLYINDGPRKGLRKVKDFAHELSRAKTSDLVTDQPGHGKGSAARRTAYVQQTDPKSHEADRFATELAEALEQGRKQRNYERLILVAAPQFMGRLKRQFGAPLLRMLTDSFEKDYTKSDPRNLTRKLEGCIFL